MTPMPAEWRLLLIQQAIPREGVHVTAALGCPRRDALLRHGAEFDPARLEARLNGQILHRMLETVAPETAEVGVHGPFLGLPLVIGKADRVREPEPGELSKPVAPGKRVFDYKGEKAGGKSRRPTGPWPEQVWQFEAYRFLLAKMGVETAGWTVWYRYGEEWIDFSHDGPLWAEEKLAAFRPHGGAWTAGELAHLSQMVADGTEPGDIPMVGASMQMGSQTLCAWCEAEEACKATAPAF